MPSYFFNPAGSRYISFAGDMKVLVVTELKEQYSKCRTIASLLAHDHATEAEWHTKS
jgi:hypothetical protein